MRANRVVLIASTVVLGIVASPLASARSAARPTPPLRLTTTEIRTLVDPRDGAEIPAFTVRGALQLARDARRMVSDDQVMDAVYQALSDLAADAPRNLVAVPRAMSNREKHPLTQRAGCATLRVADRTFHFTLQGGGPAYLTDPSSGDSIVQFSLADARMIYGTLRGAGIGTVPIFQTLFGLRSADGELGSLSTETVTAGPVEPGCGSCANGTVCTVNGHWDCCSGGNSAGCQTCRVCPEPVPCGHWNPNPCPDDPDFDF